MVRIDGLIFGYRRVRVDENDISLAASILLRARINARIKPDGELLIRERDMEKTRGLFLGKFEFSESEMLGIFGAFKRIKYKVGLITALIFSLFLMILSSNIVWDVRVDGNESLPDSAVTYALSECGFSVGNFWWWVDRSEVEARVLSSCDSLSWVNINRRGAVAYVTVKEKEETGDDGETHTGYANIVADRDCVIEEITVKCGTAAVKVGDSVKAGDLLISGVAVTESGSELCYADGVVIGRVSDTVSVFVEREGNRKISVEKELISVSVKIFGFSVNIFKRYGKVAGECVIIEEISDFSLFGRCRLPVWITLTYAKREVSEPSEYTDEELVRIATARLNSKTRTYLSVSDLIRIKTIGEYTDGGYLMKNELVFLTEVGITREFPVKEE